MEVIEKCYEALAIAILTGKSTEESLKEAGVK